MIKCIVCGEPAESCICEKCKDTTDIEKLVFEVIKYRPGSEENKLWDDIAYEMEYPSHFKNIVFSITADMESPRKEYMRLMCIAGESANVNKFSRTWLYEIYDLLKDSDKLSVSEHNRVDGIVLGAYFMDYRYAEADELAGSLMEQDNLPRQAYYNLADFYSKTRRYDLADDVINTYKRLYRSQNGSDYELSKLTEQNEKYRSAEENGKKEYMPNPKENKDDIRKIYLDFLESIGIEAEIPQTSGSKKSRYPAAIPKDQYPELKEIREATFDTFVAYDLETTGFQTSVDSMIEIGAVKVVNGNVVESAEFTFQELVKPFKRSIKPEITNLTGITKEDVKDAREMWEVFPDFMKFVGDNILLGFNNMKFDGQFLKRAGRYSNIIIENQNFDVMRYAEKYKDELGIDKNKLSLSDLSDKLEIKNPRAHRALADALTTARVYLKLKEKFADSAESNLDDTLDDLDNW